MFSPSSHQFRSPAFNAIAAAGSPIPERNRREEPVKRAILQGVTAAVAAILRREQPSTTDVVMYGCELTDRVTAGLDAMFLHGLNESANKGQVLWSLLGHCVPSHVTTELLAIRALNDGSGLCRAFTRDLLNSPGAPVSVARMLVSEKKVERMVRKLYKNWAMMRDHDDVVRMMSKLDSVQQMVTFRLRLDHPTLNEWSRLSLEWAGLLYPSALATVRLSPRLTTDNPLQVKIINFGGKQDSTVNEVVDKLTSRLVPRDPRDPPSDETVSSMVQDLMGAQNTNLKRKRSSHSRRDGEPCSKVFAKLSSGEAQTTEGIAQGGKAEDTELGNEGTEAEEDKVDPVPPFVSIYDDKFSESGSFLFTHCEGGQPLSRWSCPFQISGEDSMMRQEEVDTLPYRISPTVSSEEPRQDSPTVVADYHQGSSSSMVSEDDHAKLRHLLDEDCDMEEDVEEQKKTNDGISTADNDSREPKELENVSREHEAPRPQVVAKKKPGFSFKTMVRVILATLKEFFQVAKPRDPDYMRMLFDDFVDKYCTNYRLSSATETDPTLEGQCAVCHTVIEGPLPGRLCHLSGQVCCRHCHSDREAVIPYNLISAFDFKMYPVCNAAYCFLRRSEGRAWMDDFTGFQSATVTVFAQKTAATICQRGNVLMNHWEMAACPCAEKLICSEQRQLADLTQDPGTLIRKFSLQELRLVRKERLSKLLAQTVKKQRTHLSKCANHPIRENHVI